MRPLFSWATAVASLCSLLLPISGPAFASEPTPSEGAPSEADQADPAALPEGELGLEQCVDMALHRNPRTRSAAFARDAAEANVGVSRSAWYPSLDAAASAGVSGRLGSGEVSSGPGSAPSDTGVAVSGGFSLGYLLFDGGARSARVDLAVSQLDSARLQIAVTALDVALEAEQAFYQLQGALWYRSAVEEIIRQAESLCELARARYEVGLARRYDLAQAEARVAEALLGRAAAESEVVQARGHLATVLGLDVRSPLSIRPIAEGEENTSVADADWLIDLALARRPELDLAREQVQQALATVRIADAGHWPTVSADAGVSASVDSRMNGVSFPWSAGVGVSLPLFSGFDTSYLARRARYDEKKAREELIGRVSDVQFEVWTARADAMEAAQTIAAARKVVAAADEAVRLAEESYKTGVGTVVEVFDAQGTRASALLRLVQSRVGWYVAFSRLERAVGAALSTATTMPQREEQP